jgi:hypothetical protein
MRRERRREPDPTACRFQNRYPCNNTYISFQLLTRPAHVMLAHVMLAHVMLARPSEDSAWRKVAAGFDVVAVGVEYERAVIVLVIVRARAGWAVVFAAGGECRLVERIDELTLVASERDVHARLLRSALV